VEETGWAAAGLGLVEAAGSDWAAAAGLGLVAEDWDSGEAAGSG
jgi:hypothetical protein